MAINSVADLEGVSRAQLYDVLAWEKAPSIDWLAKIAKALKVEPWRLLKPPDRGDGKRTKASLRR